MAKKCLICELDTDIRHAIDADIVAGMNAAEIGRKYAKYIRKARPDHYIRHHKNMGHVGKEPRKTEPGTLSDIKAERHRKSVDERIDELYNLALAGCKLAIQKGEPDVRGLASCIAQGIAATELMGKPENESEKVESAFWKNYMTEAGKTFGPKKT